MGEPGRYPVVILGTGRDGYADATKHPLRDGYALTFNMDHRDGVSAPSPVPTSISVTAGDIPRGVTAAFEWETETNRPFILTAGGRIEGTTVQHAVGKIQDGTFSIEDSRTGNPYTGAVLYRHDGTDVDAEMAFFCNGDDQDAVRPRNKAGGYPAPATGDAKADLLEVVGSYLWRTANAVARLLTRDTDPTTDANFPTPVRAGKPSFTINRIVELGGSPVLLKGDGAFIYNAASSQTTYENRTPYIRPHKDNGKAGTVDGRGRVYFPTVDGDLIVLSPGRQSQQRPGRDRNVDRDTPLGTITAMAVDANHVYLALAPGEVRNQQLGLTVLAFDSSDNAYTNHTSAVT